MIIKYFFWEIIFKLRRAPIFQKLICIWHSYNTTVIKWRSHNFKIYYLIISKLSKNIYNNNPKRLPKFEGCSLTLLKVTVSENEYGPFAILWSKSAIFRGAWQNVDMQLHPWAPTALIPHIRAFKRGILLCCISRGSKVTSRQSLNVYILHHFP